MPPYSEKSYTVLPNKEPALTNVSPLLHCQGNSVPSDVPTEIHSAPEKNLHKEKILTMRNEKFVWNHSMAPKDHDRPYGVQDSRTRKQRTSRPYKREVKHEDKFRNIVQYANSDKYVLSNPKFEKSDPIEQFQKHKHKSSRGNSLTGDQNISPTNDKKLFGHEKGRKEESKIQFKGKLEFSQNRIARKITQNDSKNIKNLMLPDDVYARKIPIEHNRTGDKSNDTGQQSVSNDRNTDALTTSEPSSSSCNFRYSTFHIEC